MILLQVSSEDWAPSFSVSNTWEVYTNATINSRSPEPCVTTCSNLIQIRFVSCYSMWFECVQCFVVSPEHPMERMEIRWRLPCKNLDQWVNRSLESEDDVAVTVSLAVLEVMVRNYVFTRESRWAFWLWLLVVLPVIRLTQSWERSSILAIDLLIDWIRHDSSFRSHNKSWPLYFYLGYLLKICAGCWGINFWNSPLRKPSHWIYCWKTPDKPNTDPWQWD